MRRAFERKTIESATFWVSNDRHGSGIHSFLLSLSASGMDRYSLTSHYMTSPGFFASSSRRGSTGPRAGHFPVMICGPSQRPTSRLRIPVHTVIASVLGSRLPPFPYLIPVFRFDRLPQLPLLRQGRIYAIPAGRSTDHRDENSFSKISINRPQL